METEAITFWSIMGTCAKISEIRLQVSQWLATKNVSKISKITGIILGVIFSNFTDRTLMSNVLIIIGTMWTWIVAYTVKKFSNYKDSFHVIDLIYHLLVTLTFINVGNVPLLLLKNEIFDHSKYPWNLVWLAAASGIVFLMSATLVPLYCTQFIIKLNTRLNYRKPESSAKKIR